MQYFCQIPHSGPTLHVDCQMPHAETKFSSRFPTIALLKLEVRWRSNILIGTLHLIAYFVHRLIIIILTGTRFVSKVV